MQLTRAFVVLWLLSLAGPSAAHAELRVLNAMLYENMPEFGERLAVIYEQHFFPQGKTAPDGSPTAAGITSAVDNLALQRKAPFTRWADLVAMDIERWHLHPFADRDEHARSLALYASAAAAFRQAVEQPVCYYAVLPTGGIILSSQAATNEAKAQEFFEANEKIAAAVAPHVDALCPQLYTYYRQQTSSESDPFLQQWRASATQTIELARKLAPGKPVYAFIWPQFHSGGGVTGYPFLPDDYWRAQLTHLKGLADGIILWGGWNFETNRQLAWDDDASWWQVLKQEFPGLTETSPGKTHE